MMTLSVVWGVVACDIHLLRSVADGAVCCLYTCCVTRIVMRAEMRAVWRMVTCDFRCAEMCATINVVIWSTMRALLVLALVYCDVRTVLCRCGSCDEFFWTWPICAACSVLALCLPCLPDCTMPSYDHVLSIRLRWCSPAIWFCWGWASLSCDDCTLYLSTVPYFIALLCSICPLSRCQHTVWDACVTLLSCFFVEQYSSFLCQPGLD
jgi:hypothetical protein